MVRIFKGIKLLREVKIFIQIINTLKKIDKINNFSLIKITCDVPKHFSVGGLSPGEGA